MPQMMREKKIFGWLLVCCAGLAFFPWPASAQRIRLGAMQYREGGASEPPTNRFVVRPKLSVGARYDSNFFRTESDAQGVYTYRVSPGVEIGYETAKSSIRLSYGMDADFYGNSGDTLRDDNFLGHSLDFGASVRPYSKLRMGVTDAFHRSRNKSVADPFQADDDRDKFYINRFSPNVDYQLTQRLAMGLGYRNTLIAYDEDNSEDSTEHRGMTDLTYALGPNTSVGFGYQHWARDYDRIESDYSSDRAELVFRKEGRHFSVETGAGYHGRRFDESDAEDQDLFVYHMALGAYSDPMDDGTSKSYARAVFEQDYNDSGASENFFRARQFTVAAGHAFLGRMTADVEGFYRSSDFENAFGLEPDGALARREDDTYGVSGGLGYRFLEWASLRFVAGYEERDSNLAGLDFDNTYFMLSLDSVYDFGAL